jgi:hypothetical protein
MRRHGLASAAAIAIAVAMSFTAGSGALAQPKPADLTVLPAPSTAYTPKKTPWGDWDFRGTWPIENIASARILFERPTQYGNRFWLTDEEFAKRLAVAKASDASESSGLDASGKATSLNARGTSGMVKWMQNDPMARRTSMLVSPANGQLPPLTPWAHKLWSEGRSSWVPRQDFQWVDDFDSWDRCISRGFPASMFPFRYNNGIRILQSPGVVVIMLEMLGTRVVRLDGTAPPKNFEAWMGDSRGHWEGKTLVIETTNIKSGDGASHDPFKRAASPLNMATANVPPFNTIPTSDQAHTVERLTMTGPNTITYEITYTDPKVFTAPWTARLNWNRDDKYEMPEYACHEGDEQVRNYITSARAKRQQIAEGKLTGKEPDGNERFAHQFDFDPATMPAPPAGAPAGPPGRGARTPPPDGAYSADGRSPSWDLDADRPTGAK